MTLGRPDTDQRHPRRARALVPRMHVTYHPQDSLAAASGYN